MDGAVPPPEHVVTCFAPLADREGDEQLRFEIDGNVKSVSLRIGQMSRLLVAQMPAIAIDLIELAAFVYAIDSSVSRGGLADQQMGARWHRSFKVVMPVRMLAQWSEPNVKNELEETLMFLSGDRFTFSFVQIESERLGPTKYFDFGPESSWRPDSVVMFSGGLDSYAGALEEIIDRKHKVALISHFSATKIAPIQRALQKHMAKKLGAKMLKHIPMRVQLRGGTNTEGTHRARSFLFAALGMATALAFGKDRVSFYEYPSCASLFRDPKAIGFDQSIRSLDQLAHDGHDGDLRRFAIGSELRVLFPEIRIETRGNEGWHVEGVSQDLSATADK